LSKDLVKIRFFPILEATHDAADVTLSQKKYSLDLLWRAGVLQCKIVATPMSSSDRISPVDGALFSSKYATKYNSIAMAYNI
jgi:hypothetical protein